MSLALKGAHPAHFPQNPDKFEFDAEVSQVFPEMARLSIPLFYETHALHARLCETYFDQEQVDILDVGASRGAFIKAMAELYDLNREGVSILAVDASEDMCDLLCRDKGNLNYDVRHMDITGDEFQQIPTHSYDIINCTYVIQFVRPEKQAAVLAKLSKILKPGGMMFLGQKLHTPGPIGRALHHQYIKFRMDSGYTREEIEAKTKALANSMWPMAEDFLLDRLNTFGLQVSESSRWTVFNNYVCTKGW